MKPEPILQTDQPRTVEQTCQRIGCSRRYVYSLLARGELKSFTNGRARRIVASSIDDYIERRIAQGQEVRNRARETGA